MSSTRLLLACFISLMLGINDGRAQGSAPFVCDGSLYLSLGNGGASNGFFKVIVNQAGLVQFQSISPGGSSGGRVNAMGYRVTDNYIYGVHPNNYTLYRVGTDGLANSITTLALPGAYNYVAGDFTVDGRFLVLLGHDGGQSRIVAKVDFENNYAVNWSTLRNADGGGLNLFAADIAFDPTTGVLYGYNSNQNRLITVDPDNGNIRSNQFVGAQIAGTMGGLFFDAFGELHGYGRRGNGGSQDTFFDIDKTNGRLTVVTTGPGASQNDGCSCPYTLQMNQWVAPATSKHCELVRYAIEIANASGGDQERLRLVNQLPTDLEIVRILENPFGGSIISGVGESLLEIENMIVPVGTDTLWLQVMTKPFTADTLKNQAILYGLPAALGDSVLSDNPNTPADLDSTLLLLSPKVNLDPENLFMPLCGGEPAELNVGNPDFEQYLWSTGDTTSSIVVNSSGTYWVASMGCESKVDTFEVQTSPLPNTIITGSQGVCEGDTLRLGATGDYFFQWLIDGNSVEVGNELNIPWIETKEVSLLAIDSLGCSITQTIVATANLVPVVNIGDDFEICQGDSINIEVDYSSPVGVTIEGKWTPADGQISIELDLSIPPIPSPFTHTFRANEPGVHKYEFSVKIRDTGCIGSDSITITVLDFKANGQPIDVSCFGGNDGLFEIEVTEGLAQIRYEARNLDTDSTFAATGLGLIHTIENLPAGNYSSIHYDQNGCSEEFQFTIAQPDAPVQAILEERQNVDCFGNLTGLLDISAFGGTGHLTYTIPALGLENEEGRFENLGASIYTIEIIDENDCKLQFVDTVKSPTGLFGALEATEAVACFGDASGKVIVDAMGGTAPYRLSLDKINYVDSLIFEGLPAGLDTLFLLDANDCEVSIPFLLTEPPLLQASITGLQDIKCHGDATGTVSVHIAGGTAPYGFQVNPNDDFDFSLEAGDNTIPNQEAGTYTLVIQDMEACELNLPFELRQPFPLNPIVEELIPVDCNGNASGQVNLKASGGAPPYQFRLGGQSSQDGLYHDLPAGIYPLLLSDNNDCVTNSQVEIPEPDVLFASANQIEDAFCSLPNGSASISVVGGTGPYLYQWPIDLPANTSQSDALAPGNYSVNILDENMCPTSVDFEIGDTPPPTANFSYLPGPGNLILESDPFVTFQNQSSGAIVSYLWEFTSVSTSTDENPSFQFPGKGIYPVCLTVQDPFDACPSKFCLDIEIEPEGSVWIPNVFSPNGDGIHDVFRIKAEGIVEMEMFIFNRWGNQVYVQRQIDAHWNGMMENGQKAREGVYYYTLQATLNTGEIVHEKGHVTLLR